MKKENTYRAFLTEYLNRAVCPVQAVDTAKEFLQSQGYEELKLGDEWNLSPGGAYYVSLYDTGLCLFQLPKAEKPSAFRIAAAHTDSPGFKIKSRPEMVKSGYLELNVETYGGLIADSWYDRPLSIAGRVAVNDGSDVPKILHVQAERPVLTIPRLCIHFSRGDSASVQKVNLQKEMMPVLGLGKDGQAWGSLLEEMTGYAKDQILDYDLYVYSADPVAAIGMQGEMLQASRLDNLASVAAILYAMTETDSSNRVNVGVLFDNEEVGSKTKQGADSAMLTILLEKIASGLGYDHTGFWNLVLNSRMLSVDAAHATHPNFPEKSDPTNPIALDAGVVMKLNSAQKYASDLTFMAEMELLCRKKQIPMVRFYNHTDVRGGSTMGPMLSASLPMMTIDVGIPMLAMHSIRELAHERSCEALKDFLQAFYE